MRGRYVSDSAQTPGADQASYRAAPVASPVRRSPRPAPPAGPRRSAAEQLHSAQTRAKAARKRAHDRMRSHRSERGHYNNKPNVGVAVGLGLFAIIFVGLFAFPFVMGARNLSKKPQVTVQVSPAPPTPPANDLSENEVARRIVESVYSTLESIDTLDWEQIRPQLKETFQTILAEGSNYKKGGGSSATSATATVSAFVPTKGELLVLDDLSPAPPAAHKDILNQLVDNAHQVGFALRGLDTNDDETELLARARLAFGNPAEDAFHPQVRRWLIQQPDSLKGIVRLHWVGTDDDQSPAIQVITRANMDATWLRNQLRPE